MGRQNNDATVRQTSLKTGSQSRLKRWMQNCPAKELPFSVYDANIGMEGITPFDFMEEKA